MSTHDPIAPTVRFQPIQPGYRIGDDGSAWSCWTNHRNPVMQETWHRLKPTRQSRGHLYVSLGRDRGEFVHRLVLEAFVGPCPPGMECRHLNGDPSDNRLENLAWGTHAENMQDSIRHGTAGHLRPEHQERMRSGCLWPHVRHKSGEKHHRAKLTDEQVRIIHTVVDPATRDGAAARLAKEWGVSAAAIRMIARGLRRCPPH